MEAEKKEIAASGRSLTVQKGPADYYRQGLSEVY